MNITKLLSLLTGSVLVIALVAPASAQPAQQTSPKAQPPKSGTGFNSPKGSGARSYQNGWL